MREFSELLRCFSLRDFPCAAALALSFALATTQAFACACCTNPAWRHVETEKLDTARRAEIDAVRFSPTAKLMMTEADDDALKGVQDPEEDYQLKVERQKDRMAFGFRDGKKRTGTLTLAIPKTVSIFEVDPRVAQKDEGYGPPLYKEWKLNANAVGDGLFRAVTGGAQRMTLILHGRGAGCTSADDFSHWTLLVYGPAGKFTMYGALEKLPER